MALFARQLRRAFEETRADAPSAPCGIDGHAAEVEAAGEFQLVGGEDVGLGRGFGALRAAFAGDYLINSI